MHWALRRGTAGRCCGTLGRAPEAGSFLGLCERSQLVRGSRQDTARGSRAQSHRHFHPQGCRFRDKGRLGAATKQAPGMSSF